MFLLIKGSGRMAREMRRLCAGQDIEHADWTGFAAHTRRTVFVNFGRTDTDGALAWCGRYKVPFIQGTTGQDELFARPPCPVVLAPNLALPAAFFAEAIVPVAAKLVAQGFVPSLREKHQFSKKGRSGTALRIADALGMPHERIAAIREGKAACAEHRVALMKGDVSIELAVRVNGREAYAHGAIAVARALLARQESLKNRVYSVSEIVPLP